jgi:hypothetical protein
MEMLKILNPSAQRYAAGLTPRAALERNAVTLIELTGVYGRECVVGMLKFWIENLCRYLRVRDEMMLTAEQLEETAALMYPDVAPLSIAELSLFFVNVKKGLYGKFFGPVDGQSLHCFLREYKLERTEAMRKIISDQAAEQRKRDLMGIKN